MYCHPDCPLSEIEVIRASELWAEDISRELGYRVRIKQLFLQPIILRRQLVMGWIVG